MTRFARLSGAIVIVLAAAACSFFPGPTPSARDLALRQLALHQALWQQKGPASYVITVEQQCFCPGAEYEITVTNGIVSKVTHDGAPVRPAEVQGLPKTVPELFAVVAGLPAEAAVTVSYDEQLGYPTHISVDPIPNALDDESTIVVHGFTPAS